MTNEKEILSHIIKLGQEITQIKDVDLLLQKILTQAREFVNADGGSIYVKSNDMLQFSYAQNDSLQSRQPSSKINIYSTFSIPINNQSIAGYVANTGEIVNITNAYNLDKNVPYAFDKKYDAISGYCTHSIFAFPLKTPRNEILGVLQLINAMDENGNVISFSKKDEPFMMHFANSAAIALERAQMTREIILRMLRMAEMRDPKETGAHVNRVGAYSAEIYGAWASQKGASQEEIEKTKDLLRMTSMLHDVGKVAISDAILKKPSRLDGVEFKIIKQHTFLGAKLFLDSHSDFDEAAFYIALEHHERWDGNGYPGYVKFEKNPTIENTRKKEGNGIHPFGRIVAIADVYDALSSRRCYKEPWHESKVLRNMKEESGKQFDPEMIKAFFEVFDVFRSLREQYPDKSP